MLFRSTRSDIEKLADADAFRSIGLNRRDALWAVRALDARNAAENLPLFDRADRADLQVEPEVTLPAMLPGEEVIEDYRALSLSLKAPPVACLRTEVAKMGLVRTVDLLTVRSDQTDFRYTYALVDAGLSADGASYVVLAGPSHQLSVPWNE